MLDALLHPNDVNERCGLVLKDGTVIEVENIAEEPDRSYEMDPLAVIGFLPDVIGTWHTHPDGPSGYSGEDHASFIAWPDLAHFVISPTGVRRYEVKDGAIVECA